MPNDLDGLGALINDLTTRQEQLAPSRNRPITIYSVAYETITMSEDTASATARGTLTWTSSGSTTNLWGQGVWRSS